MKNKPTLSDLKEANEKFFNRDTMSFFGKQKFSILKDKDWFYLRVNFLSKYPREAFYDIEKETLKLFPRQLNQ